MDRAPWETAVVVTYLVSFVWGVTALLGRDHTRAGESATITAILASMAERSPLLQSAWLGSASFRNRLGRRLPGWADDVGVVVGLSALLLSLGVAGNVLEGVLTEDTEMDARIAAAVAPVAILTRAAVLISAVSSPRSTAVVAVAVIVFLVWKHRRIEAIGLFLAVGGTGLWTTLMKELVGRTRPSGVDIYHPHGMAFPSGHTTGTAALFLFLAWLIARRGSGWAGLWPYAVAAFATIVVGACRVYMAVHWVTDVIAGMALATAWIVLCVLWTRQLLARQAARAGVSAVEPDGYPER